MSLAEKVAYIALLVQGGIFMVLRAKVIAAAADRKTAQEMRERAREFELQTKATRDAAVAERAAHQCMHCERRRKGTRS